MTKLQSAGAELRQLKKELRVAEVLNESGISPAKRILELINHDELSPKEQLRAWEILLSYCETSPSIKNLQMVNVNAQFNEEASQKSSDELRDAIYSHDIK